MDILDGNFKKSVAKPVGSGIIKSDRGMLKMNLQLFGEKDIKRQDSNSLKRAIRKYEKRIEEHKDYLEKPEVHCVDWNSKHAREQEGLKRHWEKEISNFEQSINDRVDELKKRGDYNE